jgi:predicted nucleotidyltransferase
MKNKLIDLSEKIDSTRLEALQELKKIADQNSIPFIIVGAFAKELVLEKIFYIDSRRMTLDIDLAIEVSAWNKYQEFTELIQKNSGFSPDNKVKHRFYFKEIIFDIVPFGELRNENQEIMWPPENNPVMSVAGFQEAFTNSLKITVCKQPEVIINVPSLPAQVILKLIAWEEKYPERTKDATDILQIMECYQHTKIEDRLYEDEKNIMIEEEFDIEKASIRLLGKDIANISEPHTYKKLEEILIIENDEQGSFRLINDMINNAIAYDEEFNQKKEKLKKLYQGFKTEKKTL